MAWIDARMSITFLYLYVYIYIMFAYMKMIHVMMIWYDMIWYENIRWYNETMGRYLMIISLEKNYYDEKWHDLECSQHFMVKT